MSVPSLTPEEARAAWQRAEARRRFWADHREEFLHRYPDHYVAVKDGDVVAHAADLEELVTLLDAQGLDAGQVWIERFETQPVSMYL